VDVDYGTYKKFVDAKTFEDVRASSKEVYDLIRQMS